MNGKPMRNPQCRTCGTSIVRDAVMGPAPRYCSTECKPRCSIDECHHVAEKRGWCSTHYSAYRRHGDPLHVSRDMRPASERWKDSYEVDSETGCWNWTTGKLRYGYGMISDGENVSIGAYRYVWTQLRGPVPDGLQLDHLCRNRRCVNPDHLEPVTPGENVRRGVAGLDKKMWTHCVRGHEFTPENTMLINGKNRRCRTCHRMRSRAYKDANREKVRAASRQYNHDRRAATAEAEQRREADNVPRCKNGHPAADNTIVNAAGKRICASCRRAYQRAYMQKRRAATVE